MEAPEIGPPNSASKATTEPMAAPAMMPVSRAPMETRRITSIRIQVSKNSSTRP